MEDFLKDWDQLLAHLRLGSGQDWQETLSESRFLILWDLLMLLLKVLVDGPTSSNAVLKVDHGYRYVSVPVSAMWGWVYRRTGKADRSFLLVLKNIYKSINETRMFLSLGSTCQSMSNCFW